MGIRGFVGSLFPLVFLIQFENSQRDRLAKHIQICYYPPSCIVLVVCHSHLSMFLPSNDLSNRCASFVRILLLRISMKIENGIINQTQKKKLSPSIYNTLSYISYPGQQCFVIPLFSLICHGKSQCHLGSK